MSAIAHVPGASWAVAHRALFLALALVVVAAAVALAVVLTTQGSTAGSTVLPSLPSYDDGCAGAAAGTAC
jgi:hypothetical protein